MVSLPLVVSNEQKGPWLWARGFVGDEILPSYMCQGLSQLLVLGMGNLQPLIGNPYNGYINPYYWVDDPPLSYGNNGSLDTGTYGDYFITPL